MYSRKVDFRNRREKKKIFIHSTEQALKTPSQKHTIGRKHIPSNFRNWDVLSLKIPFQNSKTLVIENISKYVFYLSQPAIFYFFLLFFLEKTTTTQKMLQKTIDLNYKIRESIKFFERRGNSVTAPSLTYRYSKSSQYRNLHCISKIFFPYFFLPVFVQYFCIRIAIICPFVHHLISIQKLFYSMFFTSHHWLILFECSQVRLAENYWRKQML